VWHGVASLVQCTLIIGYPERTSLDSHSDPQNASPGAEMPPKPGIRCTLPPDETLGYIYFPESSKLHPEHPAESPGTVVGLGSVMIDEDVAEPPIPEQGSAQLADIRRGLDPTGSF
jgi:hypothetical protein